MDPQEEKHQRKDDYDVHEKFEKVNPEVDPEVTKNDGISSRDEKEWRSKQEKK